MADLYVATNGSDSNAGTQSSPFRTIQMAADAASTGSTVHVAPGTYQGGIKTSTDGVQYVSDVKWGAKIVGGDGSDMAWENMGDGARISGFEVDGTNSNFRIGLYTAGTGSVIENSRVHDLASNPDNAFDSSGGAGVYGDGYYGDTDITLRDNVIYNIGPRGQDSSLIHGMYHTTTGKILDNLIYDNSGVGIHLWHDAHNLDIAGNTVTRSNMGIYVGNGENYTYFGPADNVNVSNNNIHDNRTDGIIEGGNIGSNNTYTDNRVVNNGEDWALQSGNQAAAAAAPAPTAEHLAYAQQAAAAAAPAADATLGAALDLAVHAEAPVWHDLPLAHDDWSSLSFAA